jgi:Thr operon leader peptide
VGCFCAGCFVFLQHAIFRAVEEHKRPVLLQRENGQGSNDRVQSMKCIGTTITTTTTITITTGNGAG